MEDERSGCKDEQVALSLPASPLLPPLCLAGGGPQAAGRKGHEVSPQAHPSTGQEGRTALWHQVRRQSNLSCRKCLFSDNHVNHHCPDYSLIILGTAIQAALLPRGWMGLGGRLLQLPGTGTHLRAPPLRGGSQVRHGNVL